MSVISRFSDVISDSLFMVFCLWLFVSASALAFFMGLDAHIRKTTNAGIAQKCRQFALRIWLINVFYTLFNRVSFHYFPLAQTGADWVMTISTIINNAEEITFIPSLLILLMSSLLFRLCGLCVFVKNKMYRQRINDRHAVGC